MGKSQKEAIVEEVILALPTFKKYTDNAILMLSSSQLEDIKANLTNAIINGIVDYSKDRNNHVEVRSYSRSCVMNHLKKAKELNGGHTYKTTPVTSNTTTGVSTVVVKAFRQKVKVAPKGVNVDLLPNSLKEYAKTLV
jgi:hypothetical protein